MILPNCKVRLKPRDIEFIANSLAESKSAEEFLRESIAEGENIESILRSERLYKAITETKSILDISTELFFYIGIGNEMRRRGYDNEEAIDYVASMLSQFSVKNRWRKIKENDKKIFNTILDLNLELREAPKDMHILYYAYIGNYSLFLTGFLPEYVSKKNSSRKYPLGISFYEDRGSQGYSNAAGEENAWKTGLYKIFRFLSENFHETRTAINNFKTNFYRLKEC